MSTNDKPTNKGILRSAAVTFAAIYMLSGEVNHYMDNFACADLPWILAKLLPEDTEGIMITATYISKSGDKYTILSDKEFEGIMMNKMVKYFGAHDVEANE